MEIIFNDPNLSNQFFDFFNNNWVIDETDGGKIDTEISIIQIKEQTNTKFSNIFNAVGKIAALQFKIPFLESFMANPNEKFYLNLYIG